MEIVQNICKNTLIVDEKLAIKFFLTFLMLAFSVVLFKKSGGSRSVIKLQF